MDIQTKGLKYFKKPKDSPLVCKATLKNQQTIHGRKVITLKEFTDILKQSSNITWDCDKDFLRPIVKYILVDDYRTNLAIPGYSSYKDHETCFVDVKDLQELTNENQVTLVVSNVL